MRGDGIALARCRRSISSARGERPYCVCFESLLPVLKKIWSLRQDMVAAAAHWTGAGRVFELAHGPAAGGLILMYHSIAAPEAAAFVDPPNRIAPELFEAQVAYLARHRRVVALSELVAQIERGQTPSPDTVCITFDDGYLDNLTIAAPILARHELPATVFLATGYVTRGESQWADVLFSMMQGRTRDRISIAEPGLERLDLGSSAGMQTARRALHRQLLQASYAERCELLATLAQQLAPSGAPPRLTMNWDDVRRLRDEHPRFEFGGHTRDHIDLRSHADSEAEAQITACDQDIQRELGVTPRHFSFPYGRWAAASREIVMAQGWASAVGEGTALRIGSHTDRFSIPRIDAPRRMSDFRFKTSGAHPGLLAALGLH